jgi:hypothetical protein
MLKIADTEHQESKVEPEEEEEEHDGRSQSAEEQDCGEDKPAHKEKAKGLKERSTGDSTEVSNNLETAGRQGDSN